MQRSRITVLGVCVLLAAGCANHGATTTRDAGRDTGVRTLDGGTSHPDDASGNSRDDANGNSTDNPDDDASGNNTDNPGDDGGTVVTDPDAANQYEVDSGGTMSTCSAGTANPACASVAQTGCGTMELCGDGLDNNCDRSVDEGCPCIPGSVQDCFAGPPGHRHVGACSDGQQRCQGTGEFGTWSACEGGISPHGETCDGLDNDCNGCADDNLCCGSDLACPGPGDPRVPEGQPLTAYPLRGELFYTGDARAWHWSIAGGPCDSLLPNPTFTTASTNTRDASFTPELSGDYTVTLTVATHSGTSFSCTFVVHVAGPGLRVELCWDTSTTTDLDLHLHDPRNTNPWYTGGSGGPNERINGNSCSWANCEATLRGASLTGGRANWGYANTGIDNCRGGPLGSVWQGLGYCSNPRLDIDNNIQMNAGLPENINVDNPHDGQSFRVMIENFSGTAAHPIVNVYCGGHRRGTYGAAPDQIADFTGTSGYNNVGAMWRPVDITVHVDASGSTTGCDLTPLHPPGTMSGYDVTRNDARY